MDGGGARCEAGYGLTGYVWLVAKPPNARSPSKTDDRNAAAAEKNDTCAATNTTFLSLENICIHSDHTRSVLHFITIKQRAAASRFYSFRFCPTL